MPILSEKAILMPASPIRKLVPYSEKAKTQGITVYHLNIGQPDIETPEVALNAVKNLDRKVCRDILLLMLDKMLHDASPIWKNLLSSMLLRPQSHDFACHEISR